MFESESRTLRVKGRAWLFLGRGVAVFLSALNLDGGGGGVRRWFHDAGGAG